MLATKSNSYTFQKDGIWHFFLKVPADLRRHYRTGRFAYLLRPKSVMAISDAAKFPSEKSHFLTKIYLLALTACIALIFIISQAEETQAQEIGINPISSKFAVYYIDGEFTEGVASRFENFLLQNPPVDQFEVYLNSPGGLLSEGIELGLIFRKYNLWTSVGRFEESDIYPYPTLAENAHCASACAFAFLGGIQRRLSRDLELGFHQFYDSSALEKSLLTEDKRNEISGQAQFLSALLANYIIVLEDIDPKILIVNSLVPANEMVWLTRAQAIELKVVNNKQWSDIWLEPYKNGVIAAARRADSATGYERFRVGDYIAQATFFCREETSYLMLSARYFELGSRKLQITLEFIDEFQQRQELILSDGYQLREGEQGVWLDLELNEQIKARLQQSSFFSVDIGHYVHATQNLQLILSQMERDKISAALRFCIE